MKQVLSICKTISFGLLLIYLFSSCKVQVITVTSGDPGSGKLKMFDQYGRPADTIIVYTDTSRTIKWRIRDVSGNIDHIESMPLKISSGGTILEKRPKRKPVSKSFKATVKKSHDLMGVDGEDYNIIWVDNNKKKHTYDPRIQLNLKK